MSIRLVKRSVEVLPCWCGYLSGHDRSVLIGLMRRYVCGFVGGCKSGDQPDPAWCLGRPASDCYNAEFADTCCQTCDEYKVRNASQPGMIYNYILGWRYSVLLLSRPRSEGRPHRGRTFSIYLCPLSFWRTLPRRVLSTS